MEKEDIDGLSLEELQKRKLVREEKERSHREEQRKALERFASLPRQIIGSLELWQDTVDSRRDPYSTAGEGVKTLKNDFPER